MRLELKQPLWEGDVDGDYASASDHALCRAIHRKHGTTYYFSTLGFDAEARKRTHALYAFVRVPDEWVDNPKGLTIADSLDLLTDWRSQFIRGVDGVRPQHAVMRAFCDVVRATGMPLDEPLRFLQAMEQDLSVSRYATYTDLEEYMRGSAAAIGKMMCRIIGAPTSHEVDRASTALGEAMQLTNFIRDVGEDARRGRIYLPLEDLRSFDVSEQEILDEVFSPRLQNLVLFQIARARALYAQADMGIGLLPRRSQRPVALARILYSKILDRVEQQDANVFIRRARTSLVDKAVAAVGVWFR